MAKAQPPLRIGLVVGADSLSALLLRPDGHLRVAAAELPAAAPLDGTLAATLAELTAATAAPAPVETVLATSRLPAARRVALLVTEGFEDLLLLDAQRDDGRDRFGELRLSELCPRECCLGVSERLGADGSVVSPLTAEALTELRERVAALGVAAVAVVLLHSYQNDAHERVVAEALAPLGLPVSLSSVVARVPDERLRARATVLDALLAPELRDEAAAVGRFGPARHLRVESSGCVVPMTQALPMRGALSGVLAGLRGISRIAMASSLPRFIALGVDESGATVALWDPTLAPPTQAHSPFEVFGAPPDVSAVTVPQLGSPPGGELPVHGLRVLPFSPADDANPPARLTALLQALYAVTVESGCDPNDYPVLCYGSLGPLCAALLADPLGAPSVLVPPMPGLIAAFGALSTPLVCQRRELLLVEASSAQQTGQVAATLHALTSRLRTDLRAEGLATADQHLPGREWLAELRYQGQRFALALAGIGDGGPSANPAADLVVRFCDEHQRRFGFKLPECPVELLALRVRVQVPVAMPQSAALARLASGSEPLPPGLSLRPGIRGFADRLLSALGIAAPPRERRTLAAAPDGTPAPELTVPALLTEPTALTLVPTGWTAAVREGQSLLLHQPRRKARPLT